jgi:hypothetical protein
VSQARTATGLVFIGTASGPVVTGASGASNDCGPARYPRWLLGCASSPSLKAIDPDNRR